METRHELKEAAKELKAMIAQIPNQTSAVIHERHSGQPGAYHCYGKRTASILSNLY
jgi:hypothetical protein